MKKFKGMYRDVVRRLDIVPIPPAYRQPPAPETRDAALVRLGELELAILRTDKRMRTDLIAEKMQIQTLLSTILRRQPIPRHVAPKQATPPPRRPPASDEIPYVGPRCDHCGGEAPGGVCVNDGLDYPHPKAPS